jgi:hypothetical protein
MPRYWACSVRCGKKSLAEPHFPIGLQGDKVRIFVNRLRKVTFEAEEAASGYTVTKLQQAK